MLKRELYTSKLVYPTIQEPSVEIGGLNEKFSWFSEFIF